MNANEMFRRSLLVTIGMAGMGCGTRASAPAVSRERTGTPEHEERFAELERLHGGRLGVAAWDTGRGRAIRYRAQERFPMCSTFKLPLAAAVLQRVDAGQESLQRRVYYEKSALLEHAPVTAEHVDDGLTIEQLCAASVRVSDNTAANLLLDTLGGPPGLTAFFRRVGDGSSRLDRNEPMLNTALAGDDRDTTTPLAMVQLTERLLLGNVLRDSSRGLLVSWLVQSTTGRRRLRAGLPSTYRAGDKTGTGEHGATNDVCIAWPPDGAPLLIAAYSVGSMTSPEQREQMLAEVARIVVRP